MRKVPGLETIYRDYAPRGVQFYYVYKSLAHPEHNGYVQPFTLAERLMHVAEAERTIGSEIPWLCDTMANDLKHAMGDAPNSEFVIDPEGRVLVNRTWSNPEQLRKDLEELIGPVENPTTVADLDMKTLPPPQPAAKGVVPRVERPKGGVALRVEPVVHDGGEPFYVKLRAEAERSVLGGESGKFYLGFHLDPLYHVHWNNLTPPIRVTLTPPEKARFSETTLHGPKVEVEGDVDPREFVIDVADVEPGQTLRAAVSYFACNDEEGWCKPVSQEYVVRLEADRDGGWARGVGRPDLAADRSTRRGSGVFPGRPGKPMATNPAGKDSRPPAADGGREMGRVARVDAETNSLTVRTRDGAEQEYQVSGDAMLRINRRIGNINDLSSGDRIRFQWRSSPDGRLILRLMAR
ncbi:MAG: protein-disulfide reductase DsbD N-terminal domain-containing protein [Planctomycetes bacterium]|nr:protein-disulfide reductase DsbD N-terminal domain-containing protein [Planctomycetota bacterium]